MNPLWPQRKYRSLGQTLSANSCRWTCLDVLCKSKSVSMHYFCSNLESAIFSPLNGIAFHACLQLIMHLCLHFKKVINYGSCFNTAHFRHLRSFITQARDQKQSVVTATAIAAAVFNPNWIHHCHCIHWQAHPVIQKCKLLSWNPAGTQGQSSIGEMTRWVDCVQQKYFWYSFIFLCSMLVFWENLCKGRIVPVYEEVLNQDKIIKGFHQFSHHIYLSLG